MYATSVPRRDGLMLLCGGRDAKGTPLPDAYGLSRHRDGRWWWAEAPGEMPMGRYQHGAVFVEGRLHVVGGAVGGGRMVDEANASVVYDLDVGVWATRSSTSNGEASHNGSASPAPTEPDANLDLSRRCRHAVAALGPLVFVYGGLRGSSLLDDLLVMDDSVGMDLMTRELRAKSAVWRSFFEAESAAAASHHGVSASSSPGSTSSDRLLASFSEEEAQAVARTLRSFSGSDSDSPGPEKGSGSGTRTGSPVTPTSGLMEDPRRMGVGGQQAHAHPHGSGVPGTGSFRLPVPDGPMLATPDVRLYHRAAVVPHEPNMRGLIRNLSIDTFHNEARRVITSDSPTTIERQRTPANGLMFVSSPRSSSGPEMVHKKTIDHLLKPREWTPTDAFCLSVDEIETLCDQAEELFRQEETVLRLNAPVKIFGDLHGQFGDLMRLFEEYGAPSMTGDITYIDYLFLGDYVDRGRHSLETMALLLALKIEYPQHIHLIRGNHEDEDINSLFGFRDECMERLGANGGVKVWKRFNDLFNWLPLAAVVADKIVCMHGGIGRVIETVAQIEELQRPISLKDGNQVYTDLLWSDPTTSDAVEGVQPSPRGPGLVCFGPDRVEEFCSRNNLQMMIRAHECVMDGFERFASGKLITLFSATNYCGTANNAGAILVLGRDMVMVPKLIHPLPPGHVGVDGDEYTYLGAGDADTWMQDINEQRPPSPPRGRGGNGTALSY
jgi:protein phosphatase